MRARWIFPVIFVVSCGGEASTPAPASPSPVASNTPLERFFPLEDGHLYQWATDDNGDRGILLAKVHRTDATHGELRLSNATKRFVFTADGVSYDGGAYILKGPLAVGTSWPGEHGGTTRIATVDAAPKVLAGSYASCVQTIEEGGRVQGARYTTTYCPGVGMVLLEATALGNQARAELKSYGMPVKIE
jgi:hypothetical protein